MTVDVGKVLGWVASGIVAAGAIMALVALTIDDRPREDGALQEAVEGDDGKPTTTSGGVWARATFTGTDADGVPDPDRTLVVAMTVRGDVVVLAGGDDDLVDLYGNGDVSGNRVHPLRVRRALAGAVPESMAILGIVLSAGLLVAAVAMARLHKHLQPLWPLMGAASLGLLVVAVWLRQQTVGELTSWLTLMGLAPLDVEATGRSGLPVVGAALALSGAGLGTVLPRRSDTLPT